jgi:phage tail protein X
LAEPPKERPAIAARPPAAERPTIENRAEVLERLAAAERTRGAERLAARERPVVLERPTAPERPATAGSAAADRPAAAERPPGAPDRPSAAQPSSAEVTALARDGQTAANRPFSPTAPATAPRSAQESGRPTIDEGDLAAVGRTGAASRPSQSSPSPQDVQDSGPRVLAEGQQILVRPGDTLYQLAWRTYGTANFTTLDMLRAANPGVQDVNRIIAGRVLTFPDPGPEARILETEGSQTVLAITTPTAEQAQGVQRKLQEQYGQRVEIEPVTLGEGQRLYRVSLTDLHEESKARAIAESLGTILSDPHDRPGS